MSEEPRTLGDIGVTGSRSDEPLLVAPAAEAVDHPQHYGGNVVYEVIKIIEYYDLGFRLGNSVKYILRSPNKGATLQDLKKARWYLDREIADMERIERGQSLLDYYGVKEIDDE